MANAIKTVAPGSSANLAIISPGPDPSFAYREAMRELAGGVSIITVGTAPNRTGLTATSVASLSVDPPRLIVSVNQSSSAFSELKRCRCLGVNFLASQHHELAEHFSGRGSAKGETRFANECWHSMVTGASLLCDALAAMDCELEELIERHSHAIAIGRVVATRRRGYGDTLVYWRGDYHALAHTNEHGSSQWEPILRSRNVGCG